ncbi:MAG: DUF3164 family protein [Ferrovibrionaceae bacterium]
MTTATTSPTIPAGYMQDAKGRLVPEHLVKPVHLLEDQTVRKILGFADELNARIARFKGHVFDDIVSFMSLAAEKHGARFGGDKGNVTLSTYDGTQKVVIQVSERIGFGAELKVAKTLIDECIAAWSEGANDNIRVIVQDAFRTDSEGNLNRGAILSLRGLNIRDETWLRAMEALTDSIRIEGSSVYVRFYRRDTPQGKWEAVTIDLASAQSPSAPPTPVSAPADAA